MYSYVYLFHKFELISFHFNSRILYGLGIESSKKQLLLTLILSYFLNALVCHHLTDTYYMNITQASVLLLFESIRKYDKI